jgi:hypothetical protein
LPNLVTLFEVNFNLAHACGVAMPPCSDGRKSALLHWPQDAHFGRSLNMSPSLTIKQKVNREAFLNDYARSPEHLKHQVYVKLK